MGSDENAGIAMDTNFGKLQFLGVSFLARKLNCRDAVIE